MQKCGGKQWMMLKTLLVTATPVKSSHLQQTVDNNYIWLHYPQKTGSI